MFLHPSFSCTLQNKYLCQTKYKINLDYIIERAIYTWRKFTTHFLQLSAFPSLCACCSAVQTSLPACRQRHKSKTICSSVYTIKVDFFIKPNHLRFFSLRNSFKRFSLNHIFPSLFLDTTFFIGSLICLTCSLIMSPYLFSVIFTHDFNISL